MLLKHPKIYVDAQGNTTHAILWGDDARIVAIGDDAIAQHSGTDVVEPEGACVFPALCDAHIHLWSLGLRAGAVSMRDAMSTAEVYNRIRRYDLDSSPSGWILGTDWDQHLWEDSDELSLIHLDALWPDKPMSLRRVDGHALWVNSEALRRANITESYDPGDGGFLGRDRNGMLNGLLVDDAMHPVLDVIPEASEQEDRETFLNSARMLHSHGIVSAHKAWMPPHQMPMLYALEDAGELPLRMHLLFDVHGKGIDALLKRGPIIDDEAWLNECGIKFFADGALGSQGAAVLEPYPSGKHGVIVDDPTFMDAKVPQLISGGWQVATHAIGDAAAHNVLNSYAKADAEKLAYSRSRIEHCQMMTTEDIDRMRTMGVIASIQTIHMYSDAAWADELLTQEQLDRLFRWRDLEDATLLCAGSDYPIEDPNPWHGIATAISRLDRKGREFNGHQRLTREDILMSYTIDAAYSAFWEDHLGTLEVGKLADWIVLENDPVHCSVQELWDMRVAETWLHGQRVLAR